jgi:hypothetical protein
MISRGGDLGGGWGGARGKLRAHGPGHYVSLMDFLLFFYFFFFNFLKIRPS